MARPSESYYHSNSGDFEVDRLSGTGGLKIAFYKGKVEEFKESYIRDISDF